MLFANRAEAGEKLAERLRGYQGEKPVVLAVARGGVEVAAPLARALAAPLYVVTPRKIGLPGNPELAVGAVAPDGTAYFNEDLLRRLRLRPLDLADQVEREAAEARRRGRLYLAPELSEFTGRAVILVDDGIATGYTLLAAVRSLKRYRPARISVAVPVAPVDGLELLRLEAGEVVCLASPDPFYAVGQFYHQRFQGQGTAGE